MSERRLLRRYLHPHLNQLTIELANLWSIGDYAVSVTRGIFGDKSVVHYFARLLRIGRSRLTFHRCQRDLLGCQFHGYCTFRQVRSGPERTLDTFTTDCQGRIQTPQQRFHYQRHDPTTVYEDYEDLVGR